MHKFVRSPRHVCTRGDFDGVSRFCIQLANHQKVKCLGVVKSLEVEAYAVKAVVDFHVMLAGLGA